MILKIMADNKIQTHNRNILHVNGIPSIAWCNNFAPDKNNALFESPLTQKTRGVLLCILRINLIKRGGADAISAAGVESHVCFCM